MATGVVKQLNASDRSYYLVGDIIQILGVSQSKAYNMIRTMRKECIDSGQLTKAYPAGRIPKKYFNEKCMID